MKNSDKNVKKILLSLALIILCLSSSTISFASETILSTTVPSYFTLQIEISGHGNVETLGQEFIESGNIRIERNKSVELIFTPDENYNIAKVQFNDKDITDNLQDNGFTIDELEKDSVLSVVFAEKQESGISKTGDSTEPAYPYIALAVAACATGGLFLMKRKEE